MAVEIKATQEQNTAITQSLLPAHIVYRQSAPSSARISGKPPAIGNVPVGNRINSALVTEEDLDGNHRRFNAALHDGSQITYTKFKPVISHPATSLIASLYKHSALGESRTLQAQQKLPNLFQNSRSSQSAASRRRRGLRSFTYPTYATVNSPRQSLSGDQPHRGKAVDNQVVSPRAGSSLTQAAAPASETWTAVHASIAASGHSLLPETVDSKSRPINLAAVVTKPGLLHQAPLPQRTSVNYVPFYEIRGRGDGASVVDAPSIDVEGRKIEKHVGIPGVDPQVATSMLPVPKTTHFQEVSKYNNSSSDDLSNKKETDSESAALKQNERVNSDRTPTNTNDETLDSLVSALIRRSHNGKGSSAATPTKAGKKVRFSSAVTTNRIDEPSYTEALLESLRKRIRNKKDSHGSVSSCESKDKDKTDRASATSTSARDEEESMFVTPVMKVVVTKRHGPTSADIIGSDPSSPRDVTTNQQQPGNSPPRRVANMALRMINNYVSINPPNDILRRGTQATRRASTAGQARSSEAIARVTKLVPKRQTVVMPSFPKQSSWPTRGFPSHSTTSRMRSTVTASSAFTAAVRGSSFDASKPPPAARTDSRQNRDNLRTRLKSAGGGVYLSTAQNERPSTTPAAPERNSEEFSLPAQRASFMVATEENLSAIAKRNDLSAVAVTDFQPIPSMPDHINFCDQRKTEMVLRWLEDVNKKRNIESKLQRSASRRLKTSNQ